MKKYFTAFLFLITGVASAQNEGCMAELKSIYKKYGDITAAGIPEGKVFYLNYTTRTVMADSTQSGPITADIETWMSRENLEVKSSEMQVYQDSKEAFIILPQKKMVIRNDAVPVTKKETGMKQKRLQFIQDTLFSMSRISSCATVNTPTGAFKRLVLQVNVRGREATGIGQVLFDIDTRTQEFSRIKIIYAPVSKGLPGGVASLEYVFNEISFDHKGKQWGTNLEKKFLVSDIKVSDELKGYSLVDNRMKKNKPEGKGWK